MIIDHSILELSTLLASKQISSEDLISESFERIQRLNQKLGVLVTVVAKDKALDAARHADKTRTKGSGPLWGLPYVLKDSYLTSGIKTTAASKILEQYHGQYNSTVYERLLRAGAILVGKANMDAWGHGGTSENSDFFPVKNPWDQSRVAGGSSGGCSVAVATGMAAFAIGEDTGGSIRNPASWCNITGLKVTYGRVSRYGCIAYASSFDTVGPMAKSAQDCAVVLGAIAGHDTHDATSSQEVVPDYLNQLNQPRKQLRIGIPRELLTQGIAPEILAGLTQSEKVFTDLGFEVVDVSIPMLKYALPIYYLIAPSETSSNLARYDGVRFGTDRSQFNSENQRRIMIGTHALSSGYYDAYYKKALQARTLLIKDYQKAFASCDVILMPVTTSVAPKLGESITDPIDNMMIDLLTTSQNPAGVPALAFPAGFGSHKMPFGMQLTGPMFSEPTLFQLGHAFQQHTNWHQQLAPITQ